MIVPVYLVTGFLESGKTTTIKEILSDPDFTESEKTLILRFEEGLEEYEPEFLEKTNSILVNVEKEDLFGPALSNMDSIIQPDRVMIEFNGMWSVDEFLNTDFPDNWRIVQILSLIDASTFDLYMNNMRSLIYQQIQYSEVVIFNRCDENTKLSFLRSNIKAVNPRCQLVYEKYDGSTLELSEEDMPFNLNAPVVKIDDRDYGLWYMDALEHPAKYEGKKLCIKAMVIAPLEGSRHSIIFGRYAMVCCADDTSLLGIVVSGVKRNELHENMWLTITGEAVLQQEEDGSEVIVLKASRLEKAEELEDPLVYFS